MAKMKYAFSRCKNMLYLLETVNLRCPCWCTDESTDVCVCVCMCMYMRVASRMELVNQFVLSTVVKGSNMF